MAKDLKERLKEEMERRRVKIPQLSKELNIPKDRIYAWYRDNTNPKGADSDKIQSWLNEESSTTETASSQSPNTTSTASNFNSDILLEIIHKQADTIKSQQETIQFLTKGGAVAGLTVTTSG